MELLLTCRVVLKPQVYAPLHSSIGPEKPKHCRCRPDRIDLHGSHRMGSSPPCKPRTKIKFGCGKCRVGPRRGLLGLRDGTLPRFGLTMDGLSFSSRIATGAPLRYIVKRPMGPVPPNN